MTLTRRQFVTTSAVLGADATFARSANADDASISFLLVGDWGRHGYHHQRNVARQMARTAREIGSAYTVSVGDNFYENGVESVSDPQWQSSFENVYTEPSLQTPWKVILGNHDYRGNVQAQLDYTRHSPRWQLPARYYTEITALPGGATAAFYYLDTSPFIKKYYGTRVAVAGQNSKEQLDWLDAKLASSRAEWNVVIGHHPIYTAQSDADGYDHDQPDLIARLNPILQKHHVPLYVCGHDHVLQAVKMDGISYVCTGAGSETYQPGPAIRGGFASGAHGFMAVRLSGKRLDYSLVDEHGEALYSRSILRV
ncbi:tartrate-resistant acid phosphatase type 5 family protein [Acidocella sp.]|uniref:purple acid phosphatase family protein n=1 Tax=Acidocella sp. TaxID=50710 RepID=UPI00260E7E94|nr:tartrate-resistant acid phosphatase type 5 family protein [Acidocella sp.]